MVSKPIQSKLIPSSRPLCSVCIANYNGEKYIEECIESVLKQDFDAKLEIIVHDDASTDDSVRFLETSYPEVRVIKSEENVGFCISNNRMIDIAVGQSILLLNNDARLFPDALKTLHSALYSYGEGIYGLPQYNLDSGELIDIGSFLDPFYNPIPNKKENYEDVAMIIGACLFTTKQLWYRLGGFPWYFESLAEDMYLCCLARLQGYPVKAISKSGFYHCVGKSFGGGKVTSKNKLTTTIIRRSISERNKTYTLILCTPSPYMYVHLFFHVLLLIFEGITISILKREKKILKRVYLNSLIEVWNNRKRLNYEKKNIQIVSKISIMKFYKVFNLLPQKLLMLIKYGVPTIR